MFIILLNLKFKIILQAIKAQLLPVVRDLITFFQILINKKNLNIILRELEILLFPNDILYVILLRNAVNCLTKIVY